MQRGGLFYSPIDYFLIQISTQRVPPWFFCYCAVLVCWNYLSLFWYAMPFCRAFSKTNWRDLFCTFLLLLLFAKKLPSFFSIFFFWQSIARKKREAAYTIYVRRAFFLFPFSALKKHKQRSSSAAQKLSLKKGLSNFFPTSPSLFFEKGKTSNNQYFSWMNVWDRANNTRTELCVVPSLSSLALLFQRRRRRGGGNPSLQFPHLFPLFFSSSYSVQYCTVVQYEHCST